MAILSCCASADTWTLEHARTRWADAEKNPVPDLLYMEWVRTFTPTMTEDEIARKRAEIADKPEHPDHIRLKQAARQIASGGDRETIRAWHYSTDRYRLNIDTPYSESSPHDDYARNKEVAWSYAQSGAVAVVDVRTSPEDRDPTRLYSALTSAGTLLLQSGWGLGPAGTAPTRFEITDSAWRIHTETADGLWAYTHQGTFSPDRSDLITTETRLLRCPMPSLTGSRVLYRDHRFIPELGRFAPMSAVQIAPDNRETQRLELRTVSTLSTVDLDAVLAVPATNQADPTRDNMPVRLVMDYRPRSPAITYLNEDGSVSASQPLGTTPIRSQSLRMTGWVLAGLLAVTFGVLRVRARVH